MIWLSAPFQHWQSFSPGLWRRWTGLECIPGTPGPRTCWQHLGLPQPPREAGPARCHSWFNWKKDENQPWELKLDSIPEGLMSENQSSMEDTGEISGQRFPGSVCPNHPDPSPERKTTCMLRQVRAEAAGQLSGRGAAESESTGKRAGGEGRKDRQRYAPLPKRRLHEIRCPWGRVQMLTDFLLLRQEGV